jgi:hypothetical protein
MSSADLPRGEDDDVADLITQIRALRAVVDPLQRQLKDLGRRLDAARLRADEELVAGLDPATVWQDRELFADLAGREWNTGRGSEPIRHFLMRALKAAGGPEFPRFRRLLSGDALTVVRFMPVVALRWRQDVAGPAAAVERMMPALMVDGSARLSVRDVSDEEGPVWVDVHRMDHAVLHDRLGDQVSTVAGTLARVAGSYWTSGGPDETYD